MASWWHPTTLNRNHKPKLTLILIRWCRDAPPALHIFSINLALSLSARRRRPSQFSENFLTRGLYHAIFRRDTLIGIMIVMLVCENNKRFMKRVRLPTIMLNRESFYRLTHICQYFFYLAVYFSRMRDSRVISLLNSWHIGNVKPTDSFNIKMLSQIANYILMINIHLCWCANTKNVYA